MKYVIAILIPIAFAVGYIMGIRVQQRATDARATNEQLVELLDDVAYSYGPLKFIRNGELDKAESLLHPRLGDSLLRYHEFIDQHPKIRAGDLKMIENAQAVYDVTNSQHLPGKH